MSRNSGAGRSQRQNRVGELLRHAIAEVLIRGDIRDPALEGVSVTVTEVTVSPDLKNATGWIMPLGGEAKQEVEEALNRCAGYIRGQVSHSVALKYTPRLKFRVDHSFDQAARVDELLNQPGVRQDLSADGQESD